MQQGYKIGIVVPVYKVKYEYLEQCVSSLTEQTYKNLQIILVDDCSPDDCGKWCEEFAKKDDRISVYHHEKNRGLPEARNTGIDHLDCDWVTFVDSDDWLDLDACEKLVAYLQKWEKRPDMIIFSGYKSSPDFEERSAPAFPNETWFNGRKEIEELQKTSLRFVQKVFPQNIINLDSACWRLCNVEALRKKNLRFIDVPYREDGLFFLYSTELFDSVVYVYETFYHYRTTGNSMVNTYRPNADKEQNLYLNEVWKFMDLYQKDQEFRNLAYYPVLMSMALCIDQKFFNSQNKDSFFKKQKDCKALFSTEPYSQVFRQIDLGKLRRNHWIKAVLMKYKLYLGLKLLRDMYNLLNKKQKYN